MTLGGIERWPKHRARRRPSLIVRRWLSARMSTRVPLTRRLVAAVLLVLLTACQSWQPTTVSPQGWTPEERPASVRATLTSGEVITVRDPTMRNDSLIGAADAGVGVASRDVRLLEVRRFSVGRTLGLGVVLTGLTVGVAAVIYCAGSSPYVSC